MVVEIGERESQQKRVKGEGERGSEGEAAAWGFAYAQ